MAPWKATQSTVRILFIGDIVGRPGRSALKKQLKSLRKQHGIDFIIANGENMAAGSGITLKTFREVIAAGVDVITGGNHTWKQREIMDFIDAEPQLLRPGNISSSAHIPGRGSGIYTVKSGARIGVMNACGRVFLGTFDDPFAWAKREAEEILRTTPIIIADFHAEATSEKVAFGLYLDGLVTAVLGTHTHVQTADERVLPGGTAVITDVGMTGPHDSVLGVEKDIIIQKFLDQMPQRHEVARGDVRISAVVIDADESTGRANSILRISEPVEL